MKFCYIDESDGLNGAVVVSAGIVVDGARMHRTKGDWAELLRTMSGRLPTPLREFKASDLYRGAGRWSTMPAIDRAQVIGDVIGWIADRRHGVVFTGVLGAAFDGSVRPERVDVPDAWCGANQHLLLALQRSHQSIRAPKGQTVVVIDQGRHAEHLVSFVRTPPAWTDAYYGRRPRTEPLDQIVDVPYFVDSEHAMLVQTADLCAYVLRRHVEVTDLGERERFPGEATRIGAWARALAARAPFSDLWPRRQRTSAHDLFREFSPPALVALRP